MASATNALRDARAWGMKWLAVLATPQGVWVIWGITRLILLANLIFGQHYADPQFYQYAGDFALGRLPFRDIPVEYPPLALVLILLPALPLLPFGGIAPRPEADPHPLHPDPVRYGAYGVSFGIMMLAIDAITLVLVMRASKKLLPGDQTGAWSGLLYTIFVFGTSASLQKFDLAVGALCLGAVLLVLARRDGCGWALLAVATLIKGFPILLLPVFILWRVRGGRVDFDALKRGVIGGVVASVVTLVPTLLLGGISPLIHSVTYHTSRGIEIESVMASIALALAWIPGLGVYTTFNSADLSRVVHSPWGSGIEALGTPLLVISAVWVYALVWRVVRKTDKKDSSPEMAQRLIAAMVALILIFSLTFRAMPIHYLLGMLPLAALVRLPRPYVGWWLGLLAAALVAAQVVITIWHDLVALEPFPVLVLILRNVALVAAAVVLIRGSFFPAGGTHPKETLV